MSSPRSAPGIPAAWDAARDALTQAPVVLVLGAADAGKTTFITWLANLLQGRSLRVGIVDADLGQSEIGPPTTIGLGAVRGPIARPGDAESLALEFVGVTSPGRRPWHTAAATGRLVARARVLFDRVLVDTSGFIAGGFAAAVKARKIAASDPDVVVVIQAGDECEHLVRAFEGRQRPRVVRLPPVVGGQPRTQAARRERRLRATARYFSGTSAIVCRTDEVRFVSIRGEPVDVLALVPQTVVALEDQSGEALGVGLVQGFDASNRTVTLRTAVGAVRIATVRVGEAAVR